jgi:hypothetical protein
MKRNGTVITVTAVLLAALFAGSVLAQQRLAEIRQEATLEDVLYVSSSKTLKRMSLGYSGLLANVYWTRAVQYFGSRLHHSTRFDLLAPLLDITTDLDPHLIPAYQSGAIFLCQRVPAGAGQPDKAVALLEKGIRENPQLWRLYFTLGFVHYLDRKDYKAAEQAFQRGSEVPGALGFMRVMAARMAEHAEGSGTAIALWKAVYDTNSDRLVRDSAFMHIISLQADAEMEDLEGRIRAYQQRTGGRPSSWSDLMRAGLLRGVPLDPTGSPYRITPEGVIQVADPGKFRFLGEGREKK